MTFPRRSQTRPPRPSRSGARVVATADGPRHRPPVRHELGVHAGRPVRRPSPGTTDSFSSSSAAALVSLTNRSRANAGLKALKVDSTARQRRPLAEQGHDRARLLQPQHPGLRQGLGQAPCHRLLLQGRRREHRLEQLPGRRRDPGDPQDVHGLVGPPGQHPGQGLGRRSGSAPTRARPARRCGRSCSPTSAVRRAPKPTAKPTPKPTPAPDRQADGTPQARPAGDRATDPKAEPRRRREPAPTPTDPANRRRRSPATTHPAQRPARNRTKRTSPPTGRTVGRPERSACASSIATSSDGLLSTIVGGVTGYLLRRLTWSSRRAPRRRPANRLDRCATGLLTRRAGYTAAHAHHPRGARADQVLPARSARRRGTAWRLVDRRRPASSSP